MKIKIHKIELLIVDLDDCGINEVKRVLQEQRYPNHCISPEVLGHKTKTVDWSDDHPLNMVPALTCETEGCETQFVKALMALREILG